MATSGTTNFNLSFTDIAEEAFERAGAEIRTGYDLRTARRSMNLLTLEWANRGVNLWTIEQGAVPLVAGTATYTLPADTIDLMEFVLRTNDGNPATQSDVSISRVDIGVYSSIPNKLSSGRPVQVYVDRQRDAPTISLWPVPNNSSMIFVYWRMRRMQDAGDGIQTPDIPFRFLPALVAGLAMYLSMKISPDKQQTLQAEYERQWAHAASEDRARTTLRVVPRRSY
jgi:hypothetical protein